MSERRREKRVWIDSLPCLLWSTLSSFYFADDINSSYKTPVFVDKSDKPRPAGDPCNPNLTTSIPLFSTTDVMTYGFSSERTSSIAGKQLLFMEKIEIFNKKLEYNPQCHDRQDLVLGTSSGSIFFFDKRWYWSSLQMNSLRINALNTIVSKFWHIACLV